MTNMRPLRDLGEHPVWVRAQGIGKRYGRRQVLQDVDVCFRPGRVTALLGPNGAGKTTLLKIILGLVRPDEGTITVGDVTVGEDAGYRREIGYMPQLPSFPENLTGLDLAAMLDDLRGFDGPADESLIDALGLRAELTKPFRTLSGGNRQKLSAALALRYRAPVLILDEPTAGLDPVAARILKHRVRAERDRGCTVLLTSHELGQLQALADDVVFLLDRVLRFEGAVSEILALTGESELEGAIARLILDADRIPHGGAGGAPGRERTAPAVEDRAGQGVA